MQPKPLAKEVNEWQRTDEGIMVSEQIDLYYKVISKNCKYIVYTWLYLQHQVESPSTYQFLDRYKPMQD